jgi:hypothetical protein
MSSSIVQRRSSRTSVLGKRSHQSRLEAAPSLTTIKSHFRDTHDDDDDDDDASTVDLSPCAKRPRTSLTPTDHKGNKENIPPLRVDIFNEPSRALRRSSTESFTPTRSRSSRHIPVRPLFDNLKNLISSAPSCIDAERCTTGHTKKVDALFGVADTTFNPVCPPTSIYSDSRAPSCDL